MIENERHLLSIPTQGKILFLTGQKTFMRDFGSVSPRIGQLIGICSKDWMFAEVRIALMRIKHVVVNEHREIASEKVISKTSPNRSDLENLIRDYQKEFEITGYNEENEYWWGRSNAKPFQLHRWFIF